jgi:hypothetical protein
VGTALTVSKEPDYAVTEALKRYRLAEERERENQRKAYEDLEFLDGNQWPEGLRKERETEGRPVLTFNRMPQFVRQVANDIRLMRPSIKVVGVDSKATEETADHLNGMVRYIENRSDAQEAYYKAGDQQVAAGIGHWQIVTEYASERTFDQEIRIMPVDDGIAVLWDPDAVLATREDANWCFQPVDMTRDAFKTRFPKAVAQDFAEASSIPAEGWVTEDTIRVARYWCKKPVDKELALLPDGSVVDMADEKSAAAVKMAQQAGEKVRIEKRKGHKITHCLMSSSEVIEPEADWPGAYIPLIPVVGEETRIGRKVSRRGIIRFARDAQQAYNYAQTTQIEAVALQPKAPFLVTDDNIKAYAAEWLEANNKPLPYLRYTPDAKNGGQMPQRSPPPIASQGLSEIVAMSGQDLKDTIGIQDAGLGTQGNETSGKAIIARQGESDVGMFTYIDNHSRAVRHTGKVLVDLIPKIYDAKRVIQVMGEDGLTETVEINGVEIDPATGEAKQVNDLTVGAYDVVIEQGPGYTTRREEAKAGMLELAKMAPDALVPIMLDLIAQAQDWPLKDKIADRARMLLPPAIQAMEAEENGEQPPAPPPPDPIEEAAAKEAIAKAAKAEIDVEIAKVELELKTVELSMKKLDDRQKGMDTMDRMVNGPVPQVVATGAPGQSSASTSATIPGQQPKKAA